MNELGNISCLTCELLGDCATVDDEKLTSGYYCGDWRETDPAKVAARYQILYKFGSAGVRVLLSKPPAIDEEGK